MPTIMWSSGEIDSGTWEEIEAVAREHQFRAYRPSTFRDVLAKRAYLWTLSEVRVDGSAEQLFRDLADAKIITILDDVVEGRKG
jgi:hypothetical protein